MSFWYLNISCNKCDFSDSDIGMYGLFSYQTPQGLVPIERQLGWCHDCQGTEPIEVLPSKERIRFIEQRDYPGIWNCLGESRLLSEDDIAKDLEYKRLSREHDLQEEGVRLSILVDRNSPPRCLTCGSTNIFAIPIDSSRLPHQYDPATPTSIGVTHPNCGGELHISWPGTMSLFAEDRVYDLEGRAIPQEPQTPDIERSSHFDLFEKE